MSAQEHTFTLDGFVLSGVDAHGFLWTVEAPVRGWHDSASARVSREDRAQQNGAWPSTPFRGSRTVVLRGKVFASDTATLEGCARRLAAVLPTGKGVLSGSSTWGDLSAVVELEDAPLFDVVSHRTAVWQLAVTAPDPLLYGPAVESTTTLAEAGGGAGLTYPLAYPLDYGVAPGVTPGAVTLPNAGTASYYPTLRVDGPVPNPTVTLAETGDWVHYEGDLTDTQFLIFDMQNRRVLLNGQVSVRPNVSASGDWLAVPPGGGSITWTADAADPAASLTASGFEGAWL